MNATGEIERGEVLAWMARTGRSSSEAVDHFFPGISPEGKTKMGARFRKWAERARAVTPAAHTHAAQGSQRPSPSPTPIARPSPNVDFARLPPLERLERQVAELAVDLQMARAVGDLRTALQIDAQIAERASELDTHRARAAKTLKLDRTAGAVAAELAKKAKAIEIRAEMERRKAERTAKAAEQQQAKERIL